LIRKEIDVRNSRNGNTPKGWLGALSVAAVLGLTVMVTAQEPPKKTAEMRNKADEMLWIGDDLLIAVDFGGFVNMTAKLQAFRIPDMTELWYTEVPVGKKQRFSEALWPDEASKTLFLGRGPFSALDLTSGKVLWTIPYDSIGFVHGVEFGAERVLVLGSKTKSGFRLIWSLNQDKMAEKAASAGSGYEHLEDPILFSVNRQTGAIAWQYPFQPGKEHKKKKTDFWSGGQKKVFLAREETRLFLLIENEPAEGCTLAKGEVLIQAKGITCLNLVDGKEIWKLEKRFIGKPVILKDGFLAIKEDRLVLSRGGDGSEVWRSKDKVRSFWNSDEPFILIDQTAFVNADGRVRAWNAEAGAEIWKGNKGVGDYTIFSLLTEDSGAICVFPGKYDLSKEGYTENYLVSCVSLRDGTTKWQFDNGKDYSDCSFGPDKSIQLIEKERMWRLDPASGKVICECKKGDGQILSDCPAPMVVKNDGLHCYSRDGKKEIWKYQAKMTDEDVGSSFYTSETFVMPTKKQGLIGLDINTGKMKWTVPLPKSGELVTSESLRYVAMPVDKQLHVFDLSGSL
jgi:outer membrane protein assembly factor BamB